MTPQLLPIGKARRPAPWIVGLVTIGLLSTGSITYWVVRNQSAVPDISGMTVQVAAEPLQVRIDASGKVQPNQTVNLSPKTSGLLVELLVEQGDRVKKGQVIARMEYESVEAKLAQSQARLVQAEARLAQRQAGNRPEDIAKAEAQVAQVEAQVAEAQAQLDLAEERVQRNRSLAVEGAISSDELDEVLNQAETSRANLRQVQASLRESQRNLELVRSGYRVEEIADAKAQLAEAQADLRSVQVEYEDTFIRAPFDGVITQKYASEGAFVAPTTSASEVTSATSAAIVALAQGLEVLAEVPEVDVQQLRVGQPVEIVADSYPDQVFRGKVRLIAPEAVVEEKVTSFQVRIALETGQDKLLSGMNVDTTFLGDKVDSALVVPTVAIVSKDGETGVLVPDAENKPQFRSVTLGTAVGNQTQILEGLESGDRVFTDIPPDSQWNKAEE